jgi:hypothetical protein
MISPRPGPAGWSCAFAVGTANSAMPIKTAKVGLMDSSFEVA